MFQLSLFVECENDYEALEVLHDIIKKLIPILPPIKFTQTILTGKLMVGLKLHETLKHQLLLILRKLRVF